MDESAETPDLMGRLRASIEKARATQGRSCRVCGHATANPECRICRGLTGDWKANY